MKYSKILSQVHAGVGACVCVRRCGIAGALEPKRSHMSYFCPTPHVKATINHSNSCALYAFADGIFVCVRFASGSARKFSTDFAICYLLLLGSAIEVECQVYSVPPLQRAAFSFV